jgi:hypothetical protein
MCINVILAPTCGEASAASGYFEITITVTKGQNGLEFDVSTDDDGANCPQ